MLKPIETKEEFDEALKRLYELFDAPTGTPENEELEALADIIEAYDKEHYPIEPPDPVEAERIRREDTQ
ncbi:hypothetical protein [Dyadobacter soli]|nr:hypothetical protein [Dyadobacter soli]